MKALVYRNYGGPQELSLEDIARPEPKKKEVLLKVMAVSINSWDWDLLRGEPFIVRLAGGGLLKPYKKVLGCDVAGVVIGVGPEVKQLELNDRVFGDISADGWGGFAQFVCIREDTLLKMPDSLSFNEAAALPQAAVMAGQGIDTPELDKSGQKVLINGAGGGVGSFAIQLAKLRGAHVTAVDKRSKFSSMLALGADHTIDYTEEDFTQMGERYNLILDVVGHHSLFDFKKALLPGGRYRMIGGHTSLIFQSLILGPIISGLSNKKMGILAHQPNKNLAAIAEMVVDHKIEVVIDRIYRLEQIPEAFEYFRENTFKGKIVIEL